MGHGFLIYVTNPTPIVEEIRLFKGSVPSGLTIHTMDDRYDFEQPLIHLTPDILLCTVGWGNLLCFSAQSNI